MPRAMRIALAVEGSRGDVYPMLALAQRLRGRGHDVLLCATPDFAPDAEEHGVAFRPVGLSARALLSAQAEAVVKGGRHVLRAIDAMLDEHLRAQFETVPDAVKGADLVVGAGVQLAAASGAELHGIPLDRIRAAFYYVRDGEVVSYDDLPGRHELEQLLS